MKKSILILACAAIAPFAFAQTSTTTTESSTTKTNPVASTTETTTTTTSTDGTVTTFEPGARLVLTQGCDWRPRSTAFFATRPAAIITEGLDVLVQLVIAAITTEP